jgi:hypothetical protein
VPHDPGAQKQEGEADEAERSDPEEPDSA